MLVKELIAKLQEMPQDMVVHRHDFEQSDDAVTGVNIRTVMQVEYDLTTEGAVIPYRKIRPGSAREIEAVVIS